MGTWKVSMNFRLYIIYQYSYKHNYYSVLDKEPFHKFKVPIKSEEYIAESPEGLACSLIFTYTKTYPDTPPEIEIEDTENFEDVDENELKQHMLEEVITF